TKLPGGLKARVPGADVHDESLLTIAFEPGESFDNAIHARGYSVCTFQVASDKLQPSVVDLRVRRVPHQPQTFKGQQWIHRCDLRQLRGDQVRITTGRHHWQPLALKLLFQFQ